MTGLAADRRTFRKGLPPDHRSLVPRRVVVHRSLVTIGRSSSWNVIAAGTVIAAVPTLAVFLRFQKHFVSGLAIGAVK
jgi:ABC-type glycerol-3-phosphate transport system permease component